MNLSSLLRAGNTSCTSYRSRLLRGTILRMALLAAIVTALSTKVDATPVIDNVAFQQLDWWGEDGTLLVPNSLWGRITYSYHPEGARSYLNVTVANLSGDPVWVVQNVPLFEIEHENGSERRECVFINLKTLGLNEGNGWVNVYYRISVDGAPRIAPPTPTSSFSLVQPFGCRMLNIPMDPALPDSAFLDPFASFAPLSDSIRAETVKTGTSRDLNEVQEDYGYCVTGACARALDELNRRFGLRIIADAQDIYYALGERGVGDWSLGRGPSLYAEWVEIKDLYAKEKSNNRVVTKVWDAGTCENPDSFPQGQIAPIPGVEESGGDFLEWLKSEWKKGENVEITYCSQVAGGYVWHMVSVNDVYDSEGDTYVDIRTDLIQDDPSKGDKEVIKKWKIGTKIRKDGTKIYGIGAGCTRITFAVSESVVDKSKKTPDKDKDEKSSGEPGGQSDWGLNVPLGGGSIGVTATQDTVVLAAYTFDHAGLPDKQGWTGVNLSCRGDFSGLVHGSSVVQVDPCLSNRTFLWAFINGSTETYACGGFPMQYAVPMADERMVYMKNEIWSPPIPWTGTGSSATLEFDVYRDLTLENLVFYVWHVRSIVDGEPGQWKDADLAYYGDDSDWFRVRRDFGAFVDAGATHIQVAIGCWDFSDFWSGTLGVGACHSHAPLIDNVRVCRVGTSGPVWNVREVDLFQDSFPADGTDTGPVRIDMALDISGRDDPRIEPGDSAVVVVAEPTVGLGTDPSTGRAAVYVHVRSSGGETGPSLSDDPSRWPVVSVEGQWTKILLDSVYVDVGREVPVTGRYCVDLNDGLFTPPDKIEYYFSAYDAIGNTSYYGQRGRSSREVDVRSAPLEVQCLPTGASSILYVDDFDGRGAQPFFDSAFLLMGIVPDRYDVRGPASVVANGLGSRVTSVSSQLISHYDQIVWNSGDLRSGTIGDGSGAPEKSDDWSALFEFLDQHPSTYGAGIYISGDNICEEWTTLGGTASAFRAAYMPFHLQSADHALYYGVSPTVSAWPGGIFGYGDSFVAFGGCPIVNDFDVITPEATSRLEMTYKSGNAMAGAVLSHYSTNSLGNSVAVVLSGFSFHNIRDNGVEGIPDRVQHLTDILWFLGGGVGPPTGIPTRGFENQLAQNYPNPFNGETTIQYAIERKGRASIRIYRASGELVRTLIEEDQQPRESGLSVTWDGRDGKGVPVASGVYFYRLTAGGQALTKKMILLK